MNRGVCLIVTIFFNCVVNSVRDNACVGKASVIQIIHKAVKYLIFIHYNKNKKQHAHKKTLNTIIDTLNKLDRFAFTAT